MAGLDIFPKNIFKGTNSDGTTFRVEEWDYGTLAQIEFVESFFLLVAGIFIAAFIGPIYCVVALLHQNKFRNPFHIVIMLLCGYFVYDAAHGWIGLAALNLFLSEEAINWLIGINIASFITSFLLLIWGPNFYMWTIERGDPFSEDINKLSESQQYEISRSAAKRSLVYFIAVIALFTITITCMVSFGSNNKGWVAKHLDTKEETTQTQ